MVLSLNRGIVSLPCLLLFVIFSNSCSQSLTTFVGILFKLVGVVVTPRRNPESTEARGAEFEWAVEGVTGVRDGVTEVLGRTVEDECVDISGRRFSAEDRPDLLGYSSSECDFDGTDRLIVARADVDADDEE